MLTSMRRIFYTLIFQVLLTPYIYAQEIDNASALGSYSWEAIKVVFSLLVVLGIFYLIINAFKKYSGIKIKSNSTMHIVSGLSLGGKDKVVILQAGDINLLLGVSNSGITKLHHFTDEQLESHEEVVSNQSTFGQQIEKLLKNKNS